jgi:putative heme-binding domain-containing protein
MALFFCSLLPLESRSAGSGAQARVEDHQYAAADIRAGSRIYTAECALCHLQNGDGVDGIDLRLGQFRRAMSDDELRLSIQAGNPDAGMPAFSFEDVVLDRLIAFIRAGFDPSGVVVKLGDAARGRALFEGKGGCAGCHRVNGQGPRAAPELSDIGALRTPAALQRKLLDPTSAMMPINRPVTALTRDGRTIRGRRLNEDTYTVQMIDSQERLISLVKQELIRFEIGRTSMMPEPPLTQDELADVVAYLLTLKGLQ